MNETWLINHKPTSASTERHNEKITISLDGEIFECEIQKFSPYLAILTLNGQTFPVHFVHHKDALWIALNGKMIEIQKAQEEQVSHRSEDFSAGADHTIEAPMPGKILKILVQEGQQVAANERLFILEAMKMENEVLAPRAGRVKKIHFKENDVVAVGQVIIEMEYPD